MNRKTATQKGETTGENVEQKVQEVATSSAEIEYFSSPTEPNQEFMPQVTHIFTFTIAYNKFYEFQNKRGKVAKRGRGGTRIGGGTRGRGQNRSRKLNPLPLQYVTSRISDLRQPLGQNLAETTADSAATSAGTTAAVSATAAAISATDPSDKIIISETDFESDSSDFIEATPKTSKTRACIIKKFTFHKV